MRPTRACGSLLSLCLSVFALTLAAAPAAPGGEARSRARKTGSEGRAKKAKAEEKAPEAAPADLGAALARLVEKHSGKKWEVGVIVLDDAGKVRASIGGDRALAPASNQKVLVAGAGLGLLGPEFAYETTLHAPEAPRNGAIRSLIVRGTGDPNIPNRFQNEEPTAIFHAWAAELKKKGVSRVAGDLVVDDSYFDSVRFLPGWKRAQQASWYEAEVGALNLNDNCVGVAVKATQPGQLARVEVTPATAYVEVENRCKTVGGPKAVPTFDRRDGTNTVNVSGEISSRKSSATDPNHVTIEDPGLFFGTVLAEVLRAEGIPVEGKVVRAKLAERGGSGAVLLHQHRSTLGEDLKVINKHSQNLHAEVLLKAVGARKGGEGSVAGGARAIEGFLKTAGIPAAGLQIEDGSGLSSGNRVAPATLASVLSWISRQPYFRLYRDSLPIGGVDGTLKKRFKGKKCGAHVYAKTGYLSGASALSGYVEKGGRHWVFSLIVNGLGGGLMAARTLEEEVAELVYVAMPEK